MNNLSDIIFRDKIGLSLFTKKVVCVYFEYLKGDLNPVNQFREEYMSQYAFADAIRAYLERKYYE